MSRKDDRAANGAGGGSQRPTAIDGGGAATTRDADLTKEQLSFLFRVMLQTRLMEERALSLQRQNRIGFYLPCTGQEASHLGTAYALRDSDWIFPAYRQAGIPLLRGVDLQQIVDEWYGNADDICKGRQMPVHYSFRSIHFFSISSPLATQLTQAVGAAMAARYRGDDMVSLAYCGDGGTSENDFHSALNFAGVFRAPVVFVCENNQWAISTPLERQTASETMAVKAEAYGMPGVRVDGNDVLAVYDATKRAVERARAGEGPTLIETLTYRLGPHSSSDDPTRYRDQAEYEAWAERDPIDLFRKHLRGRKLLTKEQEEEWGAEFKQAVSEAVRAAEAKGMPSVHSMFDGVYRDLSEQLEEQRDELLSFGDIDSGQIGEFPL